MFNTAKLSTLKVGAKNEKDNRCYYRNGASGLSILERICAQHAQRKQNEHINIVIVDKNAMGVGAHSLSQPDHLLVNTVACQITLFGDATVKMPDLSVQGHVFISGLMSRAIKMLMAVI